MTREEANTKAAIDNSGISPIEAYDREINRLKEIELTLDNEFLNQPNKEFLAPDLCKFLEDYPQVKMDIERYIRHCLEQLWKYLYNVEVRHRFCKRVIELEQQLKEKEK